jgi:urease subunit gamma/beta
VTPGELILEQDPITLNAGCEAIDVLVTNAGDRPIQVGSHFHLFEANRVLVFDRALAYGHHLDVPAGTSVRFEPGEAKRVSLVPFGGARVVKGLNGLTDGPLAEMKEAALARARTHGFMESS